MHIPCAVRKELGVNFGKKMIVYLDGELHQLIAKPVIAGCMFCGSETVCEVGVIQYRGIDKNRRYKNIWPGGR